MSWPAAAPGPGAAKPRAPPNPPPAPTPPAPPRPSPPGPPGPFLAWTVELADGSEVYAARFDGAKWAAAGDEGAAPDAEGARTGHGVSDSFHDAAAPVLASGGGQLWLFWQENLTLSAPG